ncbi:ferritin-like fold-containing protein [Actinotalea sp.]|uniref:ferritin-like fold-containing protein n=1 Tax=Actinotalea sp. TaxID=1872145 RepID=UPI00356B2956
MTSLPSPGPTVDSPVPAGDGVPDSGTALAVLGMAAYGELAEFTRLAADSDHAPTLAGRLAVSRLARIARERLDLIAARIEELGGELEATMAPFAGVLVEFDERTEPSTWWERLVKGYVGYGVSDDFARTLAQGLDERTREVMLEVLADDGHAALVIDAIAEEAVNDPTLSARSALWGRRLFGEALAVVQGVIVDHPEIQRLLEGVVGEEGAQQTLFARLTAEHSRRMDRLGLAA